MVSGATQYIQESDTCRGDRERREGRGWCPKELCRISFSWDTSSAVAPYRHLCGYRCMCVSKYVSACIHVCVFVCVHVCVLCICMHVWAPLYTPMNACLYLCKRGKGSKVLWADTGFSGWFSRGLQMEESQAMFSSVFYDSIGSLPLKLKV